MRSPTPPKRTPNRHFDAIALHNPTLRIMRIGLNRFAVFDARQSVAIRSDRASGFGTECSGAKTWKGLLAAHSISQRSFP